MTTFILGRGPISLKLAGEMSQFQKTILVSTDLTPISTLTIVSYHDFCKFDFTKDDIFFICWRGMPQRLSQVYASLNHLILSSGVGSTVYNLSSVAVYGQAFNSVTEESLTIPINDYGKTKLELETFLNATLDSRLVNLRLSNVFGSPNFDDVINRLIRCSLRFESLNLYDPKMILRDFIHLEDVVQIIKDLSQRSEEISQRETFNVASGKSLYLDSLVQFVRQELERDVKLTITPISSDIIKVSRISNQKLLAFLNKAVRNQDLALRHYLQAYL